MPLKKSFWVCCIAMVFASAPFVTAQESSTTILVPTETHETLLFIYPEGRTASVRLEGTYRLPEAHGRADVRRSAAGSSIDIELQNMKPAFLFGGDYNTYVLWAVSDGKVHNLGELEVREDRGHFTGSSPVEAFGMIVTAEPHFLVSAPSDVVVIESEGPTLDSDKVEVSSVRFETLEDPFDLENETLVEVEHSEPRPHIHLVSARTALDLAEESGAAELASEELDEAQRALESAENALKETAPDADERAREAVRLAVEAKELAEIRAFEAAIGKERKAHAERIEELEIAIEEAQSEIERKELVAEQRDLQTLIEERAREEAHRLTREAARRAEVAEARASEAEEDKLEAERGKAMAERERLAAEEARIEAERERRQAEQEALDVRRERDRARAQLQDALARIADVRESARGLIVDIPNVLFEFNSASLKPQGREVLAKIAGVLLIARDASLSVEGHTDNVGSEEYNLELSEDRAENVRNYLVEQGVLPENITVKAFGEDKPIASNETAEGRQRNRRVEIVVVEGPEFGYRTSS